MITEVKGAKFSYLVQSSRNPETDYLVGLLANQGFGSCTCAQHACKVQPYLRTIGRELEDYEDPRSYCRHVRSARSRFHFQLWQDLSKSFNDE